MTEHTRTHSDWKTELKRNMFSYELHGVELIACALWYILRSSRYDRWNDRLLHTRRNWFGYFSLEYQEHVNSGCRSVRNYKDSYVSSHLCEPIFHLWKHFPLSIFIFHMVLLEVDHILVLENAWSHWPEWTYFYYHHSIDWSLTLKQGLIADE